CNGVFADDGQQPGLTADQKTVLGNLEVQVSAALNRGVAALSSTQWNDPANFYPANQPSNLYSKFIHKGTDNNRLIFIDGKAYGFPFDEPGGAPSKFEGVPLPATMTITLGTWTTRTLLRARNSGDNFEQRVVNLAQKALHDRAGAAKLDRDVSHLCSLVNRDAPRLTSWVNAALHDRRLPAAVRLGLRRAKADIAALQKQVRSLLFDLTLDRWRVRQKKIHNALEHILDLVDRLDSHLDE